MILVITMAGRQPFGNDGYRSPSYLLPWGDRTLLGTILSELSSGGSLSDVYLVANQADEAHMPHVRAILKGLDIPRENLFLIHDTAGQAETAHVGLDLIEQRRSVVDEPILFHNADTIVKGRDLKMVAEGLGSNAGYLDVFRSSNRRYSYVLLEEERRVAEIAEKIVISDTASSGLYGFASGGAFREHYVAGGGHLSGIYKRMIERGERVVAGPSYTEADTIVLSTPDDYVTASILIA